MAEEEDQGFIIRDKRGKVREETSSSHPLTGSTSDSHSGSAQAAESASQHASGSAQESTPPISFSSFIFSLGTSALMLMGEKLSPEQTSTPVNLPQAKEIVDILSILETKTQGNLTKEEAMVMKDMLYALRMKYVEASSGKKPAA